jgi:hypothetical protein
MANDDRLVSKKERWNTCKNKQAGKAEKRIFFLESS